MSVDVFCLKIHGEKLTCGGAVDRAANCFTIILLCTRKTDEKFPSLKIN